MLKRNVSGRSKTQRVKRSLAKKGAEFVAAFHARRRAMPRFRQITNRIRQAKRDAKIQQRRERRAKS